MSLRHDISIPFLRSTYFFLLSSVAALTNASWWQHIDRLRLTIFPTNLLVNAEVVLKPRLQYDLDVWNLVLCTGSLVMDSSPMEFEIVVTAAHCAMNTSVSMGSGFFVVSYLLRLTDRTDRDSAIFGKPQQSTD